MKIPYVNCAFIYFTMIILILFGAMATPVKDAPKKNCEIGEKRDSTGLCKPILV